MLPDKGQNLVSGCKTPARVEVGTKPGELKLNTNITFESERRGFEFDYYDVITLSSKGVQYYLIETPDTEKLLHFTMGIYFNDGIGRVNLFEDADREGTTACKMINRDRNSTKKSAGKLHKDITGGTTNGTSIYDVRSLNAEKDDAIILKRNAKYVLKVSNTLETNNGASIGLSWVEIK